MGSERAVHVEKGIHVPSFSEAGPPEGYERLYFGDDFCERLIPTVPALEKILEFTGSNNKKVTLLTPYCTGKGLEALRPVLEVLAGYGAGAEVVVNDLGVLNVLNRDFPQLPAVLGRLYTSMLLHPYFKCPPLFGPKNGILKFFREKFRVAAGYFEFLRANRITRVEFDNVFASPLFAHQFLAEGFKVSLYYPYTYLTTTRRCLFAGRNKVSNKLALLGCARECLDYALRLRDNRSPEREIAVRGNAQFIHNDWRGFAARCGVWGVDRLVKFGV